MQATHNCKIVVGASAYLYFAISILILPIHVLVAWMVAVTVHELGHYVALRILRVDIVSIQIKHFGIKIVTEPIGGWKEIVCASSGPLAGFCLCALEKWLPYTATLAYIHSLYNLIPIFPFDGGRISRCLFYMLINKRQKKIPLKTAQTNSTISEIKLTERYE